MLDKAKVKEIPMLFTDDMANACRIGIKTETRRTRGLEGLNENPDNWEYLLTEDGYHEFLNKDGYIYKFKNHYGQEGDVLWVREAWKGTKAPINDKLCPHIQYRADNSLVFVPNSELEWFDNRFKDGKFKWEPNMFLRRVFARTFLRRTFIRCERLQNITPESAIAEGIKLMNPESKGRPLYKDYTSEKNQCSPITSYRSLWESINGKGSWEANPWVIVVGFQKIDNYED